MEFAVSQMGICDELMKKKNKRAGKVLPVRDSRRARAMGVWERALPLCDHSRCRAYAARGEGEFPDRVVVH